MAVAKNADHVGKLEVLILEQYEEVVDQVGRLVLKLLAVMNGGGKRGFNAFFAHLLRDPLRAAGIEARGVGGRRIRGAAGAEKKLKVAQELPLGLEAPEAARRAEMAGGAVRLDEDEKRVVVAVRADVDEMKEVSGGFPLRPETILRAREEGDLLRLERSAQRFLIHVAEHEDASGDGVLHDGGNKSARFFPVKLC